MSKRAEEIQVEIIDLKTQDLMEDVYVELCGVDENILMFEKVYSVPANRYIVDTTYTCSGDNCGWSYNPDGGYSIWASYEEGRTKVRVKRLLQRFLRFEIHVYSRPLTKLSTDAQDYLTRQRDSVKAV